LQQSRHNEQTKLLEIRTAELRDAQAALGNVDIIPQADVLRMVDSLNGEIFQTAAQIADHFPLLHGEALSVDSYDGSAQRVADMLGSKAVSILTGRDPRRQDDVAIVQMALQAVMSLFASWAITVFDIGFDHEWNRLLGELNRSIYDKETQVVSSRWRALTRQHAKRLGENTESAQFIRDDLLLKLADILFLSCRCTPLEHLLHSLQNDFGEKIMHIVTQCVRIQTAIGQEVLSCNFHTIAPSFDAEYLPESMEDEALPQKIEPNTPLVVIWTTGLGLQWIEKKCDHGQEQIIKRTSIRKAQVVLQPTICDLLRDEPAQESKRESNE